MRRCSLFALTLCIASCASTLEMVVTNSSDHDVSEVTIVTGGASNVLAHLDAGATATVSISPLRDSDIEVRFSSDAHKDIKCVLDVHVTRGMRGRIDMEIKRDMSCELISDQATVM